MAVRRPCTAPELPGVRFLAAGQLSFEVAQEEMYQTVIRHRQQALVARGGDPSGVASVASFFISRIDSAVDAQIEARLQTAQGEEAAA